MAVGASLMLVAGDSVVLMAKTTEGSMHVGMPTVTNRKRTAEELEVGNEIQTACGRLSAMLPEGVTAGTIDASFCTKSFADILNLLQGALLQELG